MDGARKTAHHLPTYLHPQNLTSFSGLSFLRKLLELIISKVFIPLLINSSNLRKDNPEKLVRFWGCKYVGR